MEWFVHGLRMDYMEPMQQIPAWRDCNTSEGLAIGGSEGEILSCSLEQKKSFCCSNSFIVWNINKCGSSYLLNYQYSLMCQIINGYKQEISLALRATKNFSSHKCWDI